MLTALASQIPILGFIVTSTLIGIFPIPSQSFITGVKIRYLQYLLIVTGMMIKIAPKQAFFLPILSPIAPPAKDPNNRPMIRIVSKSVFRYFLSHTKSNFETRVSSKYSLL